MLIICHNIICFTYTFKRLQLAKTKADEIIEAGPDKSLSINNISFSVEDMDSCKEVKPEDPSGYYHYYEEQEGYYYYVISGKVVNEGAYAFDAENIKIQGVNDSTSYDGRLLFSNPEESEFIKEIRMNEELKFYLIILIKVGAPPPTKLIYFIQRISKCRRKTSHMIHYLHGHFLHFDVKERMAHWGWLTDPEL